MFGNPARIIKQLFIGISIVLLSGLIGVGYAVHSLRAHSESKDFMIRNGNWKVNPKMDLTNRYQRALISVIGLFALRESEVLYFVAREDSEGRPLDAQYDYVLEGTAPDARYWSYTLYGHDYFLVKNKANKFGFNLDNIKYIDETPANIEFPISTSKTHRLIISAKEKEGNWLPSGNEKQFFITLRMYNPSPSVYEHLEEIVLPIIKRVAS